MRWWRPDQLERVDGAVAAASEGRPTLLSIEGEPGQGKSALLDEVVGRAAGFNRLRADAAAGRQGRRYGLFEQWGLHGPVDVLTSSPFQAAQLLREAVDILAASGPVLLTVDDLQWADVESVDTVAWLLRRAAGDRLLVVAATRPLRAPEHPGWRRLLLEEGTVRLRLDGLALPEAHRLIQELTPGLDPDQQRRLWVHTEGNPLYLRTLLAEHDPEELFAAAVLPAPDDVAARTAARVVALPPEAADLLRATAVLGTSWFPLSLAAQLAELPDPHGALTTATGTALLEDRLGTGTVQVRIVHPVLRSAIHNGIPTGRRRELHRRAALLSTSLRDALWHRMQAADRHDDVLAADLAAAAADLHGRSEFREAARHLAWSSEQTADPVLRERRWLDGLFEHVLARDDAVVAHALSDVGWAADAVRRALVTAGLAIITRRWLEARHVLDALPVERLAATDPRTRYRVVVLRAWCRVMTGSDAVELVPELTRAVADPARDDALYNYLAFALGQVALAADQQATDGWRHAEVVRALRGSATTDTTRLAWRGMMFAVGGRFDEAVDVLEEVTRRAQDGLTGFGEGVFHAYLGYAAWMRGDWPSARRALGLARDARFGTEHPMVVATLPLTAISRNDPEAALIDVRRARTVLLAAPWRPAIQVAGIATVLTHRISGTDAARARILPEIRKSFGAGITQLRGLESPVWVAHLALAALWAGDVDLATDLADRLAGWTGDMRWTAPAGTWVRGLLAERRGDVGGARELMIAATATGRLDALPLHRALLADDLARVEGTLGHTAAAAAARHAAGRRFETLGLTPSTADDGPGGGGLLDSLSDRERDVVNLLVEGLSSAQIARDLFVTRSTVTFHLSRVFAKTNTSNRYELVDLLRRTGASTAASGD